MTKQINQNEINGFILAGGKSERFGINKSLVKINSKTLIERTVELLTPFVSEIFISSNDSESFGFLNKKIIKDEYENYGPLAGIHSCLGKSSTKYNFIISTDLPFASPELISFLIKNYEGENILIPAVKGKLNFLCGIYKKNIYNIADELLSNAVKKENGKINVSVFDLFQNVKGKFIEIADKPFLKEELLFNLNTQEDLKKYEILLSNKEGSSKGNYI